jgi:hypothetical protein
MKAGFRYGDAAPMAVIEFVEKKTNPDTANRVSSGVSEE